MSAVFQVQCNTGQLKQEKGLAQCFSTEVRLNLLNME